MFSRILIRRAHHSQMSHKNTFINFRTKATLTAEKAKQAADKAKKLSEKKITEYKNFKELINDDLGLAVMGWKYGWRAGGFLLPFGMLYFKDQELKKKRISCPSRVDEFTLTNVDLVPMLGLGIPVGMLGGSMSCFGAGYATSGL